LSYQATISAIRSLYGCQSRPVQSNPKFTNATETNSTKAHTQQQDVDSKRSSPEGMIGIQYWLPPSFSADSSLARARDRNPSLAGTTADQCCQDADLGEAARHSPSPVDFERSLYFTARHKRLRRCWKDVRLRFLSHHPPAPHQTSKPTTT
jgi:hypothetical protein